MEMGQRIRLLTRIRKRRIESMTVTDVIRISGNRYQIMIDEEFAFVLYKGELSSYKIEKGKNIDRETYDVIIEQVLVKRAKLRAMNLLKTKAYTEKKLREKLVDGQYPQNCIEEAVLYVKSFGYIDDKQFAEDYLFYHGGDKNKRQLLFKLHQKGVPDDIAADAYENFCQSGMAPSEEELICQHLVKKRYDPAGDEKEKNKMVRSLLQKGFSYGKVMESIVHYSKSEPFF